MTETAPATKGGVIVYLQIDGATKAAEFYQRAFAAEFVASHPQDEKGRTMHIHLIINDTSVMLGDFYPEHGFAPVPSQGFSLVIPTTAGEIHHWAKRAIDTGCTEVTPVQKMFWGDLYGAVKDPFGVQWSFNAPDTAGA